MTRASSRRAALLLGLGGALSGCGFRPVYAPASGTGPGPSADLAAIEVGPLYERPGQLLREALLARLRVEPGKPRRYDLTVAYSISGEGVGVLNITQATRIRLAGTAAWTLTSRGAKGAKLASGSERYMDSIDIFSNQLFAMDLDNEAAQRRIAAQLADKVALSLAVWFNKNPGAPG